MNLTLFYELKSRFVTREVGEELVIVPLSGNIAQMNELFTLNTTARFLWENIQQDTTPESLQQLLTEHFEVSDDIARLDVGKFLVQMEQLLNR